jgi:hypothetical protein
MRWNGTSSCSRVLLERPIVLQTVKEFRILYGARRFITVFTTACHLALSWVRSILPTRCNPISLRPFTILYIQDSVVSIMTSYGPDGPGFEFRRGQVFFFLLQTRPDQLRGPPSLLFNGCRGSFLGVKRPGFEVDHSSPSSAEVKSEWSCTSAPPMHLHGAD